MTKSDDKRVPTLRFKGFTDEWEQRKLGDVLEKFQKRINPEKENIPLWSLTVKDGLIPKNAQYNRSFLVKKNDFFNLLPDNYLIYNPMNITLGAIDINNSGKEIAVSGYYIILKIKSNYNEEFVLNNLVSRKSINLYQRFSTGSLTEKQRLQYPAFSKIKKLFPDFTEQRKIGSLLSALNKQITLQQRKLIELQLLRTSLNQQLLKDNSSWKSVKLREILNIRNKQIFPNQQYPLMSFVQKQGVVPKSQRYNRDFLVKGNKKYKVTEKGDFIYSSNNLEAGSIGINKTGNATISPVYSVFSSKNYKESLFIGLLSEKKSFIYKMIRFRQGVVYGQWKIPEKDFLNIKIKIPNYQEQEKIITLFTHIDNQFKQENKKLTDLQNFKQFLLQNMFI